ERPERSGRRREEAAARPPTPGPTPRLTGPRIFGVRPGRPILHRFTATGTKPMRFECTGLPAGVACDPATGQLSGSVAQPGTHRCTVTPSNAEGKARPQVRLVVGPATAPPPPPAC